MIKLNNRGFAVSTILYGVLSLTIIILMLVFGVMKSSKDINQELVESTEERLNNCVLSEIVLENCYFSSDTNCNVEEYYNCIDKEDESVYLHEVVSVGDFVEYDAGAWGATVPVPTTMYEFGGYLAGDSRNNSVNCSRSDNNMYNGWRVLSVNGEIVTLIHAGTPECYYHSSENDSSSRSIHYLTGVESISFPSTHDPQVHDWSYYVNPIYADSARMAKRTDLSGSSLNQTNSSYYLASAIYAGDHRNLIDIYTDGNMSFASGSAFGIRPIVVMKTDVKTTGNITNTYGFREWVLVKSM